MYLNCYSNYSLCYGTIKPEVLVQEAANLGIEKLALTDINNTTGALEFIGYCNKHGIDGVVGAEIRNGNALLYTCLAVNARGFAEINEWITLHNMQGVPYPELAPSFEQVMVVYPYYRHKNNPSLFVSLRSNEWIGVGLKDLNKVRFDKAEYQFKYVLRQPVTFLTPQGSELHTRLRAVDNNTLYSKVEKSLLANNDEYLHPPSFLHKAMEDFPQIKKNTRIVLNTCSFQFDFKAVKNKKTYTGSKTDDKALLYKLAMDGLWYRYGKDNKEAERRVRSELEIIDKLEFCSYFLITWDIIRYSMDRGFYHVGRGSGANSIVAYCLKITDVCPIELDLYFERFLNPKRKTPPDFDIDYSWKERDAVIDYIFKRYGRKHTALLGTVTTFKDKSIVRELGKVYGLPKEELDVLSGMKDRQSEGRYDSVVKEILAFEKQVRDFPSGRSIHAGGILISEEPITNYVALDMPPKGFPTTQFDMYTAEEIAFEKLDILSQRGIGHIHEAAELVRKNKGISIDVHNIKEFKQDRKVKAELKSAKSIGCFYIESPAMRGLLKKLGCEDYLTLVAASSIIRPGVAKSGMMKAYIQNYHRPEAVKYLHPVMKEQLQETFGVMVYQEDVLKVGHHYGGLDMADADVLRRLMSGKNRGKHHLTEIQDKFFLNCQEKGYPEEISKEVWRQIESFAGYSFSKAHSASYAVESYQSLYLRSHYPLEFIVAVINNFGGFYRRWVYFNEARKLGATLHLPCVNKSTYLTTLYGSDVFMGFVHVENLEYKLANCIDKHRQSGGSYKSLEDFVNRTGTSLQQLLILIKLEAFRFTEKSIKTLLWEAYHLLGGKPREESGPPLFYEPPSDPYLPELVSSEIENAYNQIELLGFPVTLNRFQLLQTSQRCEARADNLIQYVGQTIRIMGDFVTYKPVHTSNGKLMAFGTFLDEDGNFFDTTHFPPCLSAYPFQGGGVYLILGKVVEEFGFPSIEVEKLARLPLVKNPVGD